MSKKEEKIPEIPQKPTSLFQAVARQEYHVILCMKIGGRLRWTKHFFPKFPATQFEVSHHTFGLDPRQEPLFEDEKARPVYIGIIGTFGPAQIIGEILQRPDMIIEKGKNVRWLANTELMQIIELTNQPSDVHNKAFEQGEAAAVLTAGTKNQLQQLIPLWMQGLAFGGLPAGVVIGMIIAPYVSKALAGG